MWYILVEIDGLPQIEKIETDLAERLESQLGHILSPPLFRFIGRRGGVQVFTAKSSGKESDSIAEQLKRAESFLRSQPETVESFTIVVRGEDDVQQLGSEPLITDAVRFVFDVPEEDGLWCDEAALKGLFSGYGMQKCDDFYLYVSESIEVGKERAEFRELFEHYLPTEEVLDEFTPLLNGEMQGPFQIVGPEGSGRRSVVQSLRSVISGDSFHLPWMEFSHETTVCCGRETLIRAVESDFSDKIPSYLEVHEEKIWRKLSPLISAYGETVVENDILLILDLYISAYVRYMESMLFPPIISCFDVDLMQPRSFELLKRLIRRRYPGYGPLWILTAGREISLVSENEKGITCRIEPLLRKRREAVRREIDEEDEEETREGEEELGRCPLFSPYHERVLERLFENGVGRGEDPTDVLLDALDREDRALLYGISLLPPQAERNDFEDLLGKTGMDLEDIGRRMDRLSMYRLVHPEHHYTPLFRKLFLEKGTGDRETDRSMREAAAEYLRRGAESSSSVSPAHAARAFENMKMYEDAVEQYLRYAGELLFLDDNTFLRELGEKIDDLIGKIRGPVSRYRERVEELRLHIALAAGDESEAEYRFGRLPSETFEPKGIDEERLYARRVLTKSEYLWRSRNFKEALDGTKEALLRFQDLSLPEWEVRAQLLLGKIMLSLQRVEEAIEYFHNAGQKSLPDIYYGLTCESAAFVVLTHVMLGDYSLALSYADGARGRAAERGRRVWERYLGMIRGKLLCEIGRYREAAEIFQSLLLLDRLYFENERKERFIAWLSRCRMYQGFTEVSLDRLTDLEETPEHLFFRAEAHLLNRDFEGALAALEDALSMDIGKDSFIRPIYLLHRDGYEPFENIILKKPGSYDVLYQLIRAVRGFVLFRIGRNQEADNEFDDILEAEKRVKMDPYRHLYYFFRTLAYDDSDKSEELTKATYLSKAFQHMQKLAGRITEPSERRSFLKENYWNSKLFAMSREHKLV